MEDRGEVRNPLVIESLRHLMMSRIVDFPVRCVSFRPCGICICKRMQEEEEEEEEEDI